MLDLSVLFKRVGKVAAENSPAILTAIGVSGTITTAYLAAKAGFQSAEVLKKAEKEKTEELRKQYLEENPEESNIDPFGDLPEAELTTQEKVEAVWKLYAPAATTMALTVTSILLAARVQERRNAALAAAYTTVKDSYTEYRAKNIEQVGKRKEQELRDKLAQDKVDKNPVDKSVLVVTGKGDVLCRDAWSDRYVTSTKNEVDAAVNSFNQHINKHGYGSLSEFWSYLGLPPTTESDNIGWNADNKLLEIGYSGVVTTTGEPALCFEFLTLPDNRFQSAY